MFQDFTLPPYRAGIFAGGGLYDTLPPQQLGNAVSAKQQDHADHRFQHAHRRGQRNGAFSYTQLIYIHWFNSYYDNHQRPLEGIGENGVSMMLTGQVFAIMSGTATDEQVRSITRSADRYLYRREAGGYRLNTDFHELKFDMGRMFGFAYGEKENGAVFSHMTVMYANALYRRGFVREGYKALQALADAALDFQTSRIYPGIPEYFNADGRGMYHYLTGAASWYMMTVMTEAFGVHGENGDLVITPRLVREQFDEAGEAAIDFSFAGKQFHVVITNPDGKDFGEYRAGRTVLSRETIRPLPESGNVITIELM